MDPANLNLIDFDEDPAFNAAVGDNAALRESLTEMGTAVIRPVRALGENIICKLATGLLATASPDDEDSRPGGVADVAEDGTLTVRYGRYEQAAIRKAVLTRDATDGAVCVAFIDNGTVQFHVPLFRMTDTAVARARPTIDVAAPAIPWVRTFGDYVPAGAA